MFCSAWASSSRMFLTIILFIFLGRNFSNFSLVMQALAFVLIALCLYFKESKKVKSFVFAKCKGLMSFIKKSTETSIFENNFESLIFFFLKKIFSFI